MRLLASLLAFSLLPGLFVSTGFARDLRRRVNFSRIYGEDCDPIPEMAEKGACKLQTSDVEGLVFRSLDGGGAKLVLKKSRHWKCTGALVKKVFDRSCLTGPRFGIISKAGKVPLLVLIVFQPGIKPLEGAITRLSPEKARNSGCRFRLTLPLGSLADGETLVLGAK